MDINELLLGVDCECGRHHECSIEKVYIEKGATKRLAPFCKEYGKILLVADENTYGAGGERVEKALSDKEIKRVVFDGKRVLIPNEEAIERVRADLADCEAIVALGSGVIQDLCKYVSHFAKIPYIVVATAPSMDGYASDGAAMILHGMKETVKAGLPRAIVCDIDILKNAPLDMIKAGYGDIIGKFSALCDWRLANIVNGEYLCEFVYSTTESMVEKTLSVVKGLMERDEESIATLTEALITVGIMMSFAGSSRPASGSEHHLSHFFEIVGIVRGEEYFPHGIDVAYSAIVTASIREELMETPFPARKFLPARAEWEEKIKRIYGPVAEGCIALQDKVKNYITDRTVAYLKKENEIKALFKSTPTSWEIEGMLRPVGLDLFEFHKMYGTEKINDAISYAKDLKDRYTVLWTYYDLFGEQI